MSFENKIPLRLQIENVRAVQKADIVIDGLTVLCGVNGAGKSTIARLLEDAIEANLYFDDAYRAVLLNEFSREVIAKLRLFCRMVSKELINDDAMWDKFRMTSNLISHNKACELLDSFTTLLDELNSQLVIGLKKGDAVDKQDIKNVVKTISSEIGIGSSSIESLMGAFKKKSNELRQRINEIKNYSLTYENFNAADLFSPVLWEGDVNFSEMNRRIFAYSGNRVSAAERFISVKDVVYIESPLVSTLQRDEARNEMRVSGNFAPLHSNDRPPNNVDKDVLAKSFSDIMHGTIDYKKSPHLNRRWMYVRNDGKEFPLANSATGIKSFALLNVLHSYGCLNKNTVLIIDEPEAHLHPRWVVEYARMVINIIADLNVRVLIASHSPDMINALQSFAHARNLNKCTRFYQAIPVGKKHPYEFKYINRGMEVGKIFDSFNKVYPDIEKFAANLKDENEARHGKVL